MLMTESAVIVVVIMQELVNTFQIVLSMAKINRHWDAMNEYSSTTGHLNVLIVEPNGELSQVIQRCQNIVLLSLRQKSATNARLMRLMIPRLESQTIVLNGYVTTGDVPATVEEEEGEMGVYAVDVHDYRGHEPKEHELENGKKVSGVSCDKTRFFVEASTMAKAIELCDSEENGDYSIQSIFLVGNIIMREKAEEKKKDDED